METFGDEDDGSLLLFTYLILSQVNSFQKMLLYRGQLGYR